MFKLLIILNNNKKNKKNLFLNNYLRRKKQKSILDYFNQLENLISQNNGNKYLKNIKFNIKKNGM